MTAELNDQALGAYLTSLRASARLDVTVLAKRVSLSAAQVTELENGRNSLFYNRSIRLQAARKIISHLGGDLTQAQSDAPKYGVSEAAAVSTKAVGSVASRGPAQILTSPDRKSVSALAAKIPTPGMDSVGVGRSPRFMASGLTMGLVLVGMAYVATGYLSFNAPESAQALDANGKSLPNGPADTAPETSQGLKAEVDRPSMNVAAAMLPSTQIEPTAELGSDKVASKTSSSAEPCALSPNQAPVFQPAQARKPGDMVYVVSQVSQVLCVVDANGKSQVQRLEAGQGQSFYGQPPWQVVSSQLQQTQLYFQGWRVRLPAQAQDRIELVELR